jgi:dTDP-4-amino-4,6-dideoxygalactose transaminase
MVQSQIPFNRASFIGNEYRYLSQAIENGHISGDGPFSKLCQSFLEQELKVKKVLLTTSCTHALEMTSLLLDTQPGDEILLPSFTFVSTVNAFVLRGARPVFVDIRPDTLNIDESLIEDLLTPRSKVIVPVHYAGVSCEMDEIIEIGHRHNISIIEDNAHGLFGKYKDKNLGTFGNLATQSFHETKNITCGEGGAILINDEKFIERAEILREKGTNRSLFFRGQVDKYTWVDVGSSYVPSDLLAGILYAQFESKEDIQEKRKSIWEHYYVHLGDWAKNNGVKLPFVPPHCEQTYHMFYLLMPSLDMRQKLIAFLKSFGILSVFHYQPLHLSEMGRQFGGKHGDCPVSEQVSERILRLPLYYDLSIQDLDYIVGKIMQF